MDINQDLRKDQDIDLFEIYNIFISKLRLIFFITAIFAIFSVFYSLSLPDKYTSSASMQLSSESSSSGMQSLGGLSSMTAFTGFGLSAKSNKGILAINTMESRDFIKHLSDLPGFLENLMAVEGYNKRKSQTIFSKDYIIDPETKFIESNKISFLQIQRAYSSSASFVEDNKSGLIKISVTSLSPKSANFLVNLISSEVNKISKAKALTQSQLALNYLNEQLRATNEKEVKNAISKLIESQLNLQMMANIRDEYLLKTFDKAFIPEYKSAPSRSLICISITLIGFVFGVITAFIVHFYNQRKTY